MASTSLTAFLQSPTGTALATTAELANALSEVADDASSGSGINYLSFSGKTGLYALGRDQDEINPEQLYMVGPQTFVGGWVCWKGSKPIDRIEWSVLRAHEQAVAKEDLKDYGPYRESAGEGWQQLLGFQAITMDALRGEIKFSATSKSGRNAIAGLMKEIGARAAAGEPHIPLISFDAVVFEAQGQKNFKPVLGVETWVTNASATAYMIDEMTDKELVEGVKPKKAAVRAAKPSSRKKR